MKNKLPRFLRPSMRLYFILLLIFAALSFFFTDGNHILALSEAGVIVLLAIYTRFSARRSADKLSRYIEDVTGKLDEASQDALTRSPLPIVVFDSGTLNLLWCNDLFYEITGSRERFFEVRVSDIVPDFTSDWLMEGKRECPRTIAVGGRKFKVYGGVSRASGYDGAPSVATAYWVDVTEYDATREEYTASRPVTAIIAIDNYEDLVNNLNERAKSQMLSEIDAKISAWTGDTSGFLRRYDRDKYLFMFEERHLDAFIRGKFSVLEDVRGISGDAGAHASLAIGIGRGAKTFEEGARFAQLALEMALSRGGDQAVIKNRLSFEFFGGNQAAAEKRTKVRSRVMSNALGELMSDSSSVFVMGHRMSDFDSVGAAAGVCAIARSRGKQAYIVVDRFATLAAAQLDHLKSHETYAETFISSEEAIIRADSRTLLVVVDTSRPEEVQSKDLLLSCTRVAVIDHHRRAATYVENAALTYTEQYASSACELVTEMLQYLVEPKEILKVEAEALLMGIILDTKNFLLHTGSRTFDSAAFLRRLGADTVEVKTLMQSDFDTAMRKFELVRMARLYKRGIAVAVTAEKQSRMAVAQAADELLGIAGVSASFVMSPEERAGEFHVSGRSIGRINAQLICERLGGGGNQSTAGATIRDENPQAAAAKMLRAIDEYLEEHLKENTTEE